MACVPAEAWVCAGTFVFMFILSYFYSCDHQHIFTSQHNTKLNINIMSRNKLNIWTFALRAFSINKSTITNGLS